MNRSIQMATVGRPVPRRRRSPESVRFCASKRDKRDHFRESIYLWGLIKRFTADEIESEQCADEQSSLNTELHSSLANCVATQHLRALEFSGEKGDEQIEDQRTRYTQAAEQ